MRIGIAALGVCALLASSPAVAQSSEAPDRREPSGTELTLEGLTKLMLGLQRMVEELPRYNLPEINESTLLEHAQGVMTAIQHAVETPR